MFRTKSMIRTIFMFLTLVSFSKAEDDLNDRLGLLGSSLGLNPLGSVYDDDDSGEESGLESLSYPDYFDYEYDYNLENSEETNNSSVEDDISIEDTTVEVINNTGHSLDNPSGEREELTVMEQCCCVNANIGCEANGQEPRNFDISANSSHSGSLVHQSDTRVVFRNGFKTEDDQRCGEEFIECCFSPQTFLDENCAVPIVGQEDEENATEAVDVEEQECGVMGIGEAAKLPWTCVLLTRDNGFVGTCAIVSSGAVLTAAHKLNKIIIDSQLKVRVGDFDLSGFNFPEIETFREAPVDKIIRHPNFQPKRLSSDLAVILLKQELNLLQPHVTPVCLDNQDSITSDSPTKDCIVSGWGTNSTTNTLITSQMRRTMQLMRSEQCTEILRKALNLRVEGAGDRFQLTTGEVCAGGKVGGVSDDGVGCGGDGGSPLVCQEPSGKWTLIGLVTWAIGCDGPIVHVRIAEYRDWIKDVVTAAGWTLI